MRRPPGPVLLALLLALALPTTASAQGGVYFGGGATFPIGDFSSLDRANTGWMAVGGGFASIGSKGLFLGGEGFYGSNSHGEYEGGTAQLSGGGGDSDKTNLYGAAGVVGYRFGNQAKPGVYVTGNLGFMVHQYSPATGEGGSDTGFLYGAAVGLDVPAGKVNLWVEGRLMNAAYGADGTISDGYTTSFWGLFAGITIPVGAN